MSENSASLLGKIAAYTEILTKDPQSTVFVSLCEAYRQLGMLDDALEIAEKGAGRLPGFSPGLTALGRVLAQRGELTEAAQAFERALAIEKDNGLALKGLARVRYRQGQLNAARELLQQVLDQNADDPIARKMLDSLGASAPVSDSAAAAPVVPVPRTATQPEPKVTPQDKSAGASTPIPTETVGDLYRKQGLLGDAAAVYRSLLRENPHNEGVRQKLVALKQQMAKPSHGEEVSSSGMSKPAEGVPKDSTPAPQREPAQRPEPQVARPLPERDLQPDMPRPEPEPVQPRPEPAPERLQQNQRPAASRPVAEANQDVDLQNLSGEQQVLLHLDRWLHAIDQRRAAHV